MKGTPTAFVCLTLLISASLAHAKGALSFEVFAGEQFNIPTPLVIKQKGEETIRVSSAEYQSDAWTWPDSPYYAWRIGSWKKDRAWELQLVHEKITLKNEPEEVQHFEISHGYNLITINRARKLPKHPDVIWRVGGGIVLTHPETIVRNREKGYGEGFPHGFYVSGPTAMIAIGKRFDMGRKFFFVAEAMLTASYATHVPIADGHAEVPNMALHGLLGIGYQR